MCTSWHLTASADLCGTSLPDCSGNHSGPMKVLARSHYGAATNYSGLRRIAPLPADANDPKADIGRPPFGLRDSRRKDLTDA